MVTFRKYYLFSLCNSVGESRPKQLRHITSYILHTDSDLYTIPQPAASSHFLSGTEYTLLVLFPGNCVRRNQGTIKSGFIVAGGHFPLDRTHSQKKDH